MGLLDDVLSGVAGQDGPSSRGESPDRQAGGNISQVMSALLPIVLSMLSQNRATTPGRAASSGGGLGDGLGSLLGGSGGTGGLGELLSQFQRAGFGAEADSWVSRGQNRPLPPGGLEKVFGREALAEVARRAGISEADASRGLSQLLPEVVDRVTPEGEVPGLDKLAASVDALRQGQRAR